MTTVLKKTQPVVEGNHRQGLSTLNFNSPTNANASWRPDLEKNGGGGVKGETLWSSSNSKFLFYFAEAKCMPNSVAYFLYLKARKRGLLRPV